MTAVQPKRSRELKPDHVIMAGRVIATVLLPWLTAKFLLKPRVGPLRKARMLDRLAFWRSVVGLLVIVVATSYWRSTGDVMNSAAGKMMVTAGFAAYAVPLLFLVLLIATRSGHRTQLLRGALRLLGRAALASIGFLLLVGIFLVFGDDDGTQYKPADVPMLRVPEWPRIQIHSPSSSVAEIWCACRRIQHRPGRGPSNPLDAPGPRRTPNCRCGRAEPNLSPIY